MTTARRRPNCPSSNVSSGVSCPRRRHGETAKVLLLQRAHDQIALPIAPARADQERRAGGRERRRAGGPGRREVVGRRPAAVGNRSGIERAGEARVAVVAAGDDDVDLVVDIGAVLGRHDEPGGRHGDPLRIAMAEAVDRAAERVVVGDRSVERQAQDLAVERVRVLDAVLAGRLVCVADGDPERAIGGLDGAALVARAAHRLADGHDLERRQRAIVRQGRAQKLDAPWLAGVAARVARGADVDGRAVDRDAHQARLELGADVGDRRGVEERRVGRRGFEDEDPAGSFRHEHAAVRREGDVPRVLETVLHDGGVNRSKGRPTTSATATAPTTTSASTAGTKKRLAVALVDAGSRLMRRRMPNALLGGLHVGRAGTARV